VCAWKEIAGTGRHGWPHGCGVSGMREKLGQWKELQGDLDLLYHVEFGKSPHTTF
jgi:hypothetical protein